MQIFGREDVPIDFTISFEDGLYHVRAHYRHTGAVIEDFYTTEERLQETTDDLVEKYCKKYGKEFIRKK